MGRPVILKRLLCRPWTWNACCNASSKREDWRGKESERRGGSAGPVARQQRAECRHTVQRERDRQDKKAGKARQRVRIERETKVSRRTHSSDQVRDSVLLLLSLSPSFPFPAHLSPPPHTLTRCIVAGSLAITECQQQQPSTPTPTSHFAATSCSRPTLDGRRAAAADAE